MQTKLLSALLCVGTIAASQAAFASDGTITFTGTVSSQTCTVSGNGGKTTDFTVTLPTVSAAALAASGKTAGQTAFNIALSGCTTKSGKVHAYFEPGSTVNASTGRLKNGAATSAATNVEIALLNSDLSVIPLGVADTVQKSQSADIDTTSGAANLSFWAQYVATGAATAGSVSSSVTYTLVYQ